MHSSVAAPPEKMIFQLSLRRRGISDRGVLQAMEAVPRDRFVDPIHRPNAWRDTALPIPCGQTLSQPFVIAYMTEQLRIEPAHRVLEIGTGSGYHAAVLSRLAQSVVSVERFRTLADRARGRLRELNYGNVEVLLADGFALPDGQGTFDRILVTVAVAEMPQSLLDLLDPGGVLIAPIGPASGRQTLIRVQRKDDELIRRPLVDVRFVAALPGVAREL